MQPGAAANRALLAGIWAGLAIAAAASVNAYQTAASSGVTAAPLDEGIQEIIVTAQKRAENVHDVPIAITAISGSELQTLPVNNLQDFAAYVPTFHSGEPGNAAVSTLSIRGVGQRDINVHQEGAVALFTDGAYVSFIPSVGQPLYDLDRVEVLKGPQGTLFGRNATGGAISVVSKRPSQDFDAYATVRYGSFNEKKVEGAIGGGITSDFSGRLSVSYDKVAGYIKNETGPALDAVNNLGVRLQGLYKPTDDFSLLLSVRTYQAFDGPGAGITPTPYVKNPDGSLTSPSSYAAYAAYCAALNPIGPPPPGANLNGSCFASQPDRFRGSYDDISRWYEKYYGVTGTSEWVINDSALLTSISDYQHMSMNYVSDVSGTATPVFNFGIHVGSSKQLSEELRLSGTVKTLTWVGGLYFLDIKHHITNDVNLYDHPAFGVDLSAGYSQQTRSYASFGQVDWKFKPTLTLSAGARIMNDDKNLVNSSSCVSNRSVPPGLCDFLGSVVYPGALAFNRSFTGDLNNTSWSGRISLRYEPTDNIMGYVGVTRGTKAGGFNSGAAEFYPPSGIEFKPEVIYSYETGAKATFLDRRLAVDTSIFHYDYRDYQTYSVNSEGGLQILNVDASINGAELNVVARPFRSLALSVAGAYLSTRQKSVPLGNGKSEDFQIPDAPKWSSNAQARYDFALPNTADLGFQVNAVYVGERSISAIDFADQRIPSYTRLDTRIDCTTADKRWTVAAFLNNVSARVIVDTRVDFTTLTGNAVESIQRPRWWGFSFTYRH